MYLCAEQNGGIANIIMIGTLLDNFNLYET